MCHGCQEINSFEGSPTSFTRGPWMMLKTQSIRRIGPWSCEMLRYNCDNETKWPKIKNVRKRKTSDKIEKVLLRKDFRRLLRLFLQLGLVVQGHHGLLWSLSSLAGPTTPGRLETILWRGHQKTGIYFEAFDWIYKPWSQKLGASKKILWPCAPNLKKLGSSNQLFLALVLPKDLINPLKKKKTWFGDHQWATRKNVRKVETVFGLHYLEKLPLQSVPEPGRGTLDQGLWVRDFGSEALVDVF